MAACALYAAGHLFMAYNCCFRSTPVYHFYDVAEWVRENTGRDETIGVFQSGTIGYLSDRRVVNLDGKVNGHALAALRGGTLDEYLREEKVDMIMDHHTVIDLFLGEDYRFDQGRCFSGAAYGLPGWVGYRLSSAGRTAAGHSRPLPHGSSPAR